MVLEQAGHPATAVGHYRKAEAIIVRLSAHDPSNATWRNDRRWLQERIAAVGSGDGRNEE